MKRKIFYNLNSSRATDVNVSSMFDHSLNRPEVSEKGKRTKSRQAQEIHWKHKNLQEEKNEIP